jgi:5-methylcytosine-specific restriction endonuclease McrA
MLSKCIICGIEMDRKANKRYCSDDCKKISAQKGGRNFASKEAVRKTGEKYRRENSEKLKMIKLSYRMRLKYEVLSYYADNGIPICARCGETDPDVLVLDHINDDGAEQRKKLNIASRDSNGGAIRGQRSYEAYKKSGYPDGLQILCANCNTKKQLIKNRKNHMKNPFYKQYIESERRLAWIKEW